MAADFTRATDRALANIPALEHSIDRPSGLSTYSKEGGIVIHETALRRVSGLYKNNRTNSATVVEAKKSKEQRTDNETKQDDKTISSYSSKNEQDWTNNNKTTISNNNEERDDTDNNNKQNKTVHFAHFSSVY
eukprot:CAMPEP_0201122988 /NCGR_PEP_ID=MMETSP0850-20130426/6483_1 /ASSEMBLY_ACC=CAM_ASM_000622 /TAXON_ID=183588 /ORGANISM="Pseudo-nitzschia fraudulenta, Strain WWA7" /LENGTH=132 /DNA_ID=CAMNT_0047389789 /DNA_START=178 /DNA_END=574 /DNA_ORIENTATION=+